MNSYDRNMGSWFTRTRMKIPTPGLHSVSEAALDSLRLCEPTTSDSILYTLLVYPAPKPFPRIHDCQTYGRSDSTGHQSAIAVTSFCIHCLKACTMDPSHSRVTSDPCTGALMCGWSVEWDVDTVVSAFMLLGLVYDTFSPVALA